MSEKFPRQLFSKHDAKDDDLAKLHKINDLAFLSFKIENFLTGQFE